MLNILRRIQADKKPRTRVAGSGCGPGERDKLTGAVTKRAFQKKVESVLADSQGNGCLLLVDVDCMRRINESFGRETGDRVLQAVFEIGRAHV